MKKDSPMPVRNFPLLIESIRYALREAPQVNNARWQSNKIEDLKRFATFELRNEVVRFWMDGEDLQVYRDAIRPNLPWADRHFELERVSGEPINPGTTWREWPYAQSADRHRREDECYDHTYAERYWPRYGTARDIAEQDEGCRLLLKNPYPAITGLRFRYGDLEDLVDHLSKEPTTRQAYLPVWFPEDLGAIAGGKRVPCTLGYHFMVREDRLHVNYYIRSCDFVRHFRDDVYLTVRLALWVLEQCRLAQPSKGWDDVRPGEFTMYISSLHIFRADYRPMLGAEPPPLVYNAPTCG